MFVALLMKYQFNGRIGDLRSVSSVELLSWNFVPHIVCLFLCCMQFGFVKCNPEFRPSHLLFLRHTVCCQELCKLRMHHTVMHGCQPPEWWLMKQLVVTTSPTKIVCHGFLHARVNREPTIFHTVYLQEPY
jgi:hypothetical protein